MNFVSQECPMTFSSGLPQLCPMTFSSGLPQLYDIMMSHGMGHSSCPMIAARVSVLMSHDARHVSLDEMVSERGSWCSDGNAILIMNIST